VNAQSLRALAILGAVPAQPRDRLGRFTAVAGEQTRDPYNRGFSASARVSFDPGARATPTPPRDPVADHGRLLVGLVRARRLGPRDPGW
jgi:hypothetical protein